MLTQHIFDLSLEVSVEVSIEQLTILKSDNGDTRLGFQCVGVKTLTGCTVDASLVLGETYLSLEAIEDNLGRSVRRLPLDLMDMADISQASVDAWDIKAKEVAQKLLADGKLTLAQVAQLPDESAEVTSNGHLRIFVEIAGEQYDMLIPPAEWSWKKPAS